MACTTPGAGRYIRCVAPATRLPCARHHATRRLDDRGQQQHERRMTVTPTRPYDLAADSNVRATAVAGASIRSNNFDLIRLLAALQVVVTHGFHYLGLSLWAPLGAVIDLLPGVPIFFVVSGFLISLSWERAPSATHYVRNRLVRIFPALWVCLGVSTAFFLASGVRPDSASRFLAWLAAQLTIGQFYNPTFLRGFGVGVLNGSLWTIPVELQFYLLLPILALLARRRPARWVLLAVIAGAVMWLSRPLLESRSDVAQKLFAVTIVPYLFYFLVGVLARYLHERSPEIFNGRGLVWAAIYAAWCAIELHFGIAGAQGNLLNVVSLLLIAMLTVSLAFSARTLSARVLHENDISYGLYIYHMPVVNLLLAQGVSGPARVATYLASTLLLAILSWRLIEKPALSLKEYSLRSSQRGRVRA